MKDLESIYRIVKRRFGRRLEGLSQIQKGVALPLSHKDEKASLI
jgi:hypothetical protein